ncbi:MAG: PqqD family protein [Bacillota bacterium]|nr:PqqD family protein [Bacillota bacterium]
MYHSADRFNFQLHIERKPVFVKDNVEYARNEKNGFVSCHSNKALFLNDLIINPIGIIILELCDGTRNVVEIIDTMLEKYKGVTRERISEDLIKVLYQYTTIGLVDWIGGNPFMYDLEKQINENYTITLAKEEDFRDICTFFKEDILKREGMLNYINPGIKLDEYRSEVYLREKLFAYSEEFFLLKKDGKIEGMLSVVQPVNKFSLKKTTVAGFGVLSLPVEYASAVINFAKELTPEISVANVSKMKLLVIKDGSVSEEVVSHFQNSGFESECLLRHEVGEKDLEVYSYIY